jgi:hypothetical protein
VPRIPRWTVAYRDGHVMVDLFETTRGRALAAACELVASGKQVLSVAGEDELIYEGVITRVSAARL